VKISELYKRGAARKENKNRKKYISGPIPDSGKNPRTQGGKMLFDRVRLGKYGARDRAEGERIKDKKPRSGHW